MEENKDLVEETVEQAAESINENAEVAVEAGKAIIDEAKKMDIWSLILIIIAAVGLAATGGWIVYLVVFFVKKIKAKKAAALEPQDNDVFVEVPEEEEKTE